MHGGKPVSSPESFSGKIVALLNRHFGILLISACFLTQTAWGAGEDQRGYFWPSTLMEPAWGLENDTADFFGTGEFEEDSGDDPTAKIGLRYARGLAKGFGLRAHAQLIRFNSGHYTAWGAAETELGLRWKVVKGEKFRPTLQLKGDLYLPTGGMSATDWAASGGLNLSWKKNNWGFHLNGLYTGGEGSPGSIGVSEVDRWRVAGGTSYRFMRSGGDLTFAFVGAQPTRSKPNEWSLEVAARIPLSHRFVGTMGVAAPLRDAGIDWIIRFGMGYEF